VLLAALDQPGLAKDELEERLYERMLTQVPSLERFLAVLAVCASAAPLLGLLGTVTGMIHTFRLISVFGTGSAPVLSAGIAEALITTEYGLYVAIPALLMHAYLSRRVRRLVAVAQELAVEYLNAQRPTAAPAA
jgi:biopolymer transport protein ExbB